MIISVNTDGIVNSISKIQNIQSQAVLFFEFLEFTQTFPESEYIPENIIRKMVSKSIDSYLDMIFNFDPTLLAEFESFIILYPLLGKLVSKRGFRWISCFGWHQYREELYRIGWKVIPDGGIPSWRKGDKANDQFRRMARIFEIAERMGILPSINKLLFTKAKNKKPLVFIFDSAKEDVLADHGHKYLSNNRGYLYASLSNFYFLLTQRSQNKPSLLETIYKNISGPATSTGDGNNNIEDSVLSFAETVNKVLENAEKYVHEGITEILDDMADLVGNYEDLPNSTELRNYIIWLACHDFKTKCVAFFPALLREELPTAGVLVAFDSLPSAEDLIKIENFVNHAFLIKTSLMMEIDPGFPVLFHRASFRVRFRALIAEAKKRNESILFIVIDMDDLKKKNDFVHDYGNLYLHAFVNHLKGTLSACRHETLLGRWGGDEFMIGVRCPSKNIDDIIEQLDQCRIEMENKDSFNVSIENGLSDMERFSHWNEAKLNRMRGFYGSDQATSFTGLWASWPSQDFDQPEDLPELINGLREIKLTDKARLVDYSVTSEEIKAKVRVTSDPNTSP